MCNDRLADFPLHASSTAPKDATRANSKVTATKIGAPKAMPTAAATESRKSPATFIRR
jgi:hypothetical protein